MNPALPSPHCRANRLITLAPESSVFPRKEPGSSRFQKSCQRQHWLPKAAVLLILGMAALFGCASRLVAQPWTSPADYWGSVTINVRGGANADNFSVFAVDDAIGEIKDTHIF